MFHKGQSKLLAAIFLKVKGFICSLPLPLLTLLYPILSKENFLFSQQFKLQTKQYPYFSHINLDKSEILR